MPKRNWLPLLVLALLFLLTPSVFAAEPDTVEIVVRKGDTLSYLCREYLDNPASWNEIARINRLQNPNRIFPNQKLVVPVTMLRGVPVSGVATFVKGVVELKESEGGAWRPVQLHEQICQGAAVRTGPESAFEVTYQDGVSLLLREKSEIAIVASREKSAVHKLFRFFINVGRAISTIKRGTGVDNRYEILTPSAVAAARGTEFRVAVDSDEASRMEVLEGRVGVKAGKTQVEVKENFGTIVRPNAAPIKPKELLPPPVSHGILSLYRSMPLVFEFEQVEGAGHAVVVLSRDRDAKDIVREKLLLKGEILEIIGVDDGGYFLHSRSVDRLGLEGISSDPVPVQVRVNPLPPFIQEPQDGAETKDPSFLIRWLAVSDAVHYRLQIASDPDFNNIVDEQQTFRDVQYKTPNLDLGTYYFRVASAADDGYEGIWSDVTRFSLIPPPPVPPVEEPQQSDTEIVLRWHSLGTGATYHLQMAGDEAFGNILHDSKLDAPSAVIPLPEKAGTYFVRVSGIDPEGYEGSFSKPQSFEVKSNLDKWAIGGWLTILAIVIAL